jgi:hypothetical protein
MTTPADQYNPNVPKTDDDLATSQGNFLSNFQQLYDAFLKNHVALDDPTNPGKHNVIELLSSNDPFNTNVSELSFYAKPVEGQTDQLFMRYQGNETEVQMINYQLYSLQQTPNVKLQYFSFLPGRILVYMGIDTIPGYPFMLNLLPPIAKNIIACNFCPAGKPSQPTIVDPVVSNDGIIRQLKLQTPFSLIITNELMTYFVMANI